MSAAHMSTVSKIPIRILLKLSDYLIKADELRIFWFFWSENLKELLLALSITQQYDQKKNVILITM